MEESEICKQALEWGRQNYPEAPEIHHLGFASVILFAYKSRNRRAVIKTMRTLVAIDIFYLNRSRPLCFDEAVDMFKDACYGEINIKHAKKWKHDRPERDYLEDVNKAKELISTLQSEVIHGGDRDH